jgi:hypothetical protein
MLRDTSIEQSLALLGYARIETRIGEWADIHRPFVFKAKWDSADVEHFLYFGADIKRRKYLVGRFGFRSRVAEDFSIESLLKYGHPNYKFWIERHDRQIGCTITFDLDRFNFAKGRIDHRTLVATEDNKLAQHVTVLVRNRLLPIVQEVTTLAKFLQVLASDVEPYPWFTTNSIVRAAEIIAIGSHLGMPRRMIRDMLTPSYHLISMNLIEPSLKFSVDQFLDRLLADWAQGYSSRMD